MKQIKITTIGSATVDEFLSLDQAFKTIKIGDKVLINKVEKHSGGGAVNSAIALSKMGIQTTAIIKLGNDNDSKKIIKDLKNAKVKIQKTKPSNKKTSFSVIMCTKKDKDRIIYTYKGASDELLKSDINPSTLNSDCIYLATLLKKGFNTMNFVASYAKNKKIKLLFNPSSYLAKMGHKKLKTILKATHFLILNRSEARSLLKTKNNNIDYLLTNLNKLGPKIVVITRGEKGVFAYDGKNKYFANAFKVKVANTAGAGDAFASGFLATMLKYNNIEKALTIGNANSAGTIQKIGANIGQFTLSQANSFLKKHKLKITKTKIKGD